jgi:hypothetical protein
MNVKSYAALSAIIFAVVALMHLVRLVWQWDVIIAGHIVPMWVSLVGAVVAGLLSFAGFRVFQQIHKYLA